MGSEMCIRDSTSVLRTGEIQVMTAGTGIIHSEFNNSPDRPVKFLQIWVFPKVKDTPPEYHNYDIRPLLQRNKLGLFISPDGETPARLLQDAWFSMGTFDAGQTVEYELHQEGNGVYMFVIEGEVSILGEHLGKRDGMGIWDTKDFQINITKEAQILLMEVPMKW